MWDRCPSRRCGGISRALRFLMANREKCRQMGKHGRSYTERHHSREVGTAAFGEMIGSSNSGNPA